MKTTKRYFVSVSEEHYTYVRYDECYTFWHILTFLWWFQSKCHTCTAQYHRTILLQMRRKCWFSMGDTHCWDIKINCHVISTFIYPVKQSYPPYAHQLSQTRQSAVLSTTTATPVAASNTNTATEQNKEYCARCEWASKYTLRVCFWFFWSFPWFDLFPLGSQGF